MTMNVKKTHVAFALLLALGWMTVPAGAATIELIPSAPVVFEDAEFTIDLRLDARDVPGPHPALWGGEVVVDFDPAQLRYDGFELAAGLNYFEPLMVGTADDRATVSFGFDNAADLQIVGTFRFTVLADPGAIDSIGVEDTDQFFGTFVRYTPGYAPFIPDFIGTSIEVEPVPLPGSALLLLTALGGVLARVRRHGRRLLPQPA
jgi:hypothetical protein